MQRLGAISLLMLMWAWPALAADKLAPLDGEFLEFLGSFDADEEDWALFVDDEPPPSPAKAPAAKPVESKKEAAAPPADKQ